MRKTWAVGTVVALGGFVALVVAAAPRAYPPMCLETRQRRCTACHQDTAPWGDPARALVDIADPQTKESFAQADGTFRIPVRRGQERRILVVVGADASYVPRPTMTGWLLFDPSQLAGTAEASPKFAPGWEVNRPYGCKRLRDTSPVERHAGRACATTTMTIRPLEGAADAEVELQVILKSANETLEGNYFERRVRLVVEE